MSGPSDLGGGDWLPQSCNSQSVALEWKCVLWARRFDSLFLHVTLQKAGYALATVVKIIW